MGWNVDGLILVLLRLFTKREECLLRRRHLPFALFDEGLAVNVEQVDLESFDLSLELLDYIDQRIRIIANVLIS